MKASQVLRLAAPILAQIEKLVELLKSKGEAELTKAQQQRVIKQMDKFERRAKEQLDRITDRIGK